MHLKRGVLNWKMGFGKLIGVWCLKVGGYHGLWLTRRDWATSVVVLSIGWTSLFAVFLICHLIPHRPTYSLEKRSTITYIYFMYSLTQKHRRAKTESGGREAETRRTSWHPQRPCISTSAMPSTNPTTHSLFYASAAPLNGLHRSHTVHAIPIHTGTTLTAPGASAPRVATIITPPRRRQCSSRDSRPSNRGYSPLSSRPCCSLASG
jgi:hypothetical protein